MMAARCERHMGDGFAHRAKMSHIALDKEQQNQMVTAVLRLLDTVGWPHYGARGFGGG
jgi:hypothetical protein